MAVLQREEAVRYDCPHCRAKLEWSVGRWGGWVACPACARPAQPPRPRFVIPPPGPAPFEATKAGAALRAEEWIAAGDVPDPAWPVWSRGLSLPRPRTEPEPTALRTALAVGLGISLFLLLVAFLDQNGPLTGFSALIALVCFWGRMKLTGRR